MTDGATELVYLSNPRYYSVDPFTFYVQDASGVIGSGICTVVVNPGAGVLSVLTDEERALLSIDCPLMTSWR